MEGVDKKRCQAGISYLIDMLTKEKGAIKEYDFYHTEDDFACEGQVIVCGFEGGVTPVFYFLVDAMTAQKY